MNKPEIDKLYHLLRVASNNTPDVEYHGQQSKIFGLAKHLLAGSDYLALIQYSAWYGERFLVKPAYHAMVEDNIIPKRIVEIGSGLGWLSRGLSHMFEIGEAVTVDKRPWCATNHMLDIENEKDRAYLKETYPHTDKVVIAMSDFLHCTDIPKEIIDDFADYPMIVLEYVGYDEESFNSYCEQLGRYGALVPEIDEYASIFAKVSYRTRLESPYAIITTRGPKQ